MNDLDIWLYLSFAVPSGISLICNSIVIYFYLRFPALHKKSCTTIAVLCIFDTILELAGVIPYNSIQQIPILCYIQGMMIVFSEYASILWIGYISLLICIDTFKLSTDLFKNFYKCLVFIIFFSILISTLPYAFSGYGYIGGHCWITGTTKFDKLIRILSFVCPVAIVTTISGFTILISARNHPKHISKRMILYALIIIIAYLPICLIRSLQELNVQIDQEAVCLGYLFFPLGGLADSLIFGFTSGIWKIIRQNQKQSDFFEMNSN